MKQDLKNDRKSIKNKSMASLSKNLLFSSGYFCIVFYICKDRPVWFFVAFLLVYNIVECFFCASLLKRLQNPIDDMLDTVKKVSQDKYEAQNLRSQAEIFALQSQINPHFLYNTLDTIRGYAMQSDAKDIAVMTESLSTLFRYSISRPGEMATLKEELDNVKNYLLIQQYRFPDKVNYVEEIEDENILNYQMPILTIQPIVENAIHHGLEMKIGKGCIKIKAFRTDSDIILFISDDGLGMSEEKLEELRSKLEKEGDDIYGSPSPGGKKGSGIALINVDKRLKFYYGSQHGLKIRSTLDIGTMIEINLPLMNNSEYESRKEAE